MRTKGIMMRTLLLVAMLAIVATLVAAGKAGAFPPLAATSQPGMAVESAPAVDASKAEAGLLAITPSRISYQGRLTDPATGLPKPDGAYSLTFRLYDAATGGTLLQTVSRSVTTKDGLFSTTLDLSQGYFDGQNLYLEIQVGTETLSPRQQLTAVPYALGLRPGARSLGALAEPVFSVENSGSGYGLWAGSTSNIGVFAWTGLGTFFVPDGNFAVYGMDASGVGGYGVYGGSENGHGVAGHSTSGTGVEGRSTSGDGVRGVSSSGAGVLGASTSGTGVHGVSGTGPGLVGFSTSGAAAFAASTDGVGVHGLHSATSGTEPGVRGETNSTADYAAGVIGRVTSTAPGGSSAGVRGINEGTMDTGIGVWGSQNGSGLGVLGTSVSGRGVAGFSGSPAIGWMVPPGPPAAGVYGDSSSGDGVFGISNSGVGVFGRSLNGFAMQAVGNTRQSRDKGGWVKAIYRYTAAGDSCFRGDDGASAATANTCTDFSRTLGPSGQAGDWIITFPFTVNDRFIVITPQWGGDAVITVDYEFPAPNQVRVRTRSPGGGTAGPTWLNSAFTLVVF